MTTKIKFMCTISWKTDTGRKSTKEDYDINIDKLAETNNSISSKQKDANDIFKKFIIKTLGKEKYESREPSIADFH